MLLSGGNFRPHRFWVAITSAILVGCLVWFVVEKYLFPQFRQSGSSPATFTFGVLGGLICLFEFLLWPRKKWLRGVRAKRIGSVQLWLRAHIWFGILSLPVVLLHSGFSFQNPLATALTILVALVVFSGGFGLYLQQSLPRRMFDEVPSETIHSQIGHVMTLQTEELARLVEETCGPPPDRDDENVNAAAAAPQAGPPLAVSVQRAAGNVRGKVLETRTPHLRVPNSEPLRLFFAEIATPYLLGQAKDSPLRLEMQASARFRDLRSRLDKPAHDTANAVEELCEQRRQLDLQTSLHFWLHSWLWVHLPLSILLIVSMFVHIYVAWKWW